MIWIAIFLLLLALAVAIMTLVIDDMIDKIEAFFLGGFSCILLFIGLSITIDCLSPSITPMDVYQGKTTLKYEVVDGVKESPSKTFPRVNEFETGASYRH